MRPSSNTKGSKPFVSGCDQQLYIELESDMDYIVLTTKRICTYRFDSSGKGLILPLKQTNKQLSQMMSFYAGRNYKIMIHAISLVKKKHYLDPAFLQLFTGCQDQQDHGLTWILQNRTWRRQLRHATLL